MSSPRAGQADLPLRRRRERMSPGAAPRHEEIAPHTGLIGNFPVLQTSGGHVAEQPVPRPPRAAAGVPWWHRSIGDARMKLTLDLHEIYNRGQDIDRALRDVIDEAVRKKAPVVEIIPGKGSGQLKKHVLRFLEQKDIKALYHRVEKDSKNFGRIFVHFRWK
jgi:hypothetical protein